MTANEARRLLDIIGITAVAALRQELCDDYCDAVCRRTGCGEPTTTREPDAERNYCEACGGNTVIAAPQLALRVIA